MNELGSYTMMFEGCHSNVSENEWTSDLRRFCSQWHY